MTTHAAAAPMPDDCTGGLAHTGATVTDAEFVVDATVVAIISLAICVASDRLVFMTALVPALLLLRFVAWLRVRGGRSSGSFAAELLVFAVCLTLGAFNDWNSVVSHRIYDYSVPHFFPQVSTIPLWMLLFWGMILRLVATLCRWERLGPPARPIDVIHFGGRVVRSAWLKVLLQLVLVVVTRQLIYRYYPHPVVSWAPFAAAILLYLALFRPDEHDRKLLLIALIGGPLIEIAYIQLGNLHHYHLGWLGGVPLWIALWWVLAVLIWKDLTLRLQTALTGGARTAPSAGSA